MISSLITYNRSDRCYHVADPTGEIVRFPAKEKAAAFEYAVAVASPELHEAVRKIIARNPQFERRAWKAAELVADGRVEIFPAATGPVGRVASTNEYGWYSVQQADGYLTCECEDFIAAAAPVTATGARYCKHLLAYRLALLFEERF